MPVGSDLATFRIYYPEFSAVPDAEVEVYITRFNEELVEAAWGTCYGLAVLALTAHELALSQLRRANAQVNDAGLTVTSSGIGGVTEASAADLHVSYQAPQAASTGEENDAYYMKTEYGQQYVALKRKCMPRGIVIGCQ